MSKKANSKRWMREYLNDEYVKKAQKYGFRSRAAYKLIEINDKNHFIKSGSRVLDLGSAPGSWSQVAAQKVAESGQVIAIDILKMKPISGVDFIQGDFTEDSVYAELLARSKHAKINVVLSDMAPNMSGQLSVDIPKSMYLCELALAIALKILTSQGVFFSKVFQGEGFDTFIQSCRQAFNKVSIHKPKASKPRSKEVYLLASGLKTRGLD